MFPSFIGILDIQSWWEVPSIAYFCSLFRTAFNLLDFDIEELEEALLTDGTEESSISLLTELIVRLLNGCSGNNDVSAFNYQMYLRRLFRRKCQDSSRFNPFNDDIDFQFLPLRTKVEILYALCDFRLEANDVFDLFKNLEAESLRVEPLGWDDKGSAYWYFYGTRLYREDITKKPKGKAKKKKIKSESRSRGLLYGDALLEDENTERVWQVVCFTEEDWTHLTEKFSKASSKIEKELYQSLSENFLPEIPRLFQEKERLQRKRLLELAPRRTSNRVLQKIRQKEEDSKPSESETNDTVDLKEKSDQEKDNRSIRAKRRQQIRSQSGSSSSSDSTSESDHVMPQKVVKRLKSKDKRSKNSSSTHKGEPPPEIPIKTGRKTNNSLANETGQIVIPENIEPVNSTRRKLKTSQIFSQSEEDVQTDMYKILEQLIAHDDAWPFIDPVEEEYAPNYYAVIRRPMDLKKMEERLDTGYYSDFNMFKADFKLIVNNCRLYNGQDNEYTTMVDNLQVAFDRLIEKYMDRVSSSDEEIAVEYQIPTPSRKHKLKINESPPEIQKKRRKFDSETGEGKSSDHHPDVEESPTKEEKESHHKSEDSKIKKKRKHRHGKHSRNRHKKTHRSGHSKESKHSRKQKHSKDKEQKKKRAKKNSNSESKEDISLDRNVKREPSVQSTESSNRSRSASPLPSIHTPSPTPPPSLPPSPIQLDPDPDFYKDKFDKIKERRRAASKGAWDNLKDHNPVTSQKQKSTHPKHHKDKNPKLRETIEKLKAKNEKYSDESAFGNIFASRNKEPKSKRERVDVKEYDDDSREEKPRPVRKTKKVTAAKNESASEALEQAVKDISKWLDDAPKGSGFSSPCDSPAQTISTEEQDSRQDDDFLIGEKSSQSRKDSRKRPSSKEPKLVKKREIQRTIERLQPGKSKGNLLTSSSTKTVEKVGEKESSPAPAKINECVKTDETSLKLSLGSVLPTVEFTIGNDHNFDDDEENVPVETKEEKVSEKSKEKVVDEPVVKKSSPVKPKKHVKTKTTPEPKKHIEVSQEKATPNLSAWFKAFGTPKSTPPTPAAKKKPEKENDSEDKLVENITTETKPASPKIASRYDSPTDPETPNPDGGDSPLPSAAATSRQRRTSTGSSVSERSSFSQDLDSPRHQMSLTSPLLRSPASPRTDDFQKITYPIINGTVRAGFYQDTTSIRSSPEKSSSPREGPRSPYSPYPQHVYANNSLGSSTPNYFVDQNKSPSLVYGQNQPSQYYDASKASVSGKSSRSPEYAPLSSEAYPQTQFGGAYSPVGSPYGQTHPPTYSQPQQSPQLPQAPKTPDIPKTVQHTIDKTSLYPMKKRTYNEIEMSPPIKKAPENKIIDNNYQKMIHQTMQISMSESTSVSSDKSIPVNCGLSDNIISAHSYNPGKRLSNNLDVSKQTMVSKNNSIDMVNMGYMNPENERRNSGEAHDEYGLARENLLKSSMHNQPKGYEIDAIAMNLGMNNQNLQRTLAKSTANVNLMGHSLDRAHSGIPAGMDQNLGHNTTRAHVHTPQAHVHTPQAHAHTPQAHAHTPQAHAHTPQAHVHTPQAHVHTPQAHAHTPQAHAHTPQAHAHTHDYNLQTPSTSGANNFSLSDIELANKKLYNASTSANPLDYGNWKHTNQMKKPDTSSAEYISAYNAQHQYHGYNASRASLQRPQEAHHLQSELRIPNPRNLIKSDNMNSRSDHQAINSTASSSENIAKETDSSTGKQQKADKHVQNHPFVGAIPYKTAYSAHSSLPIDSLCNLPHVPQMLDRYSSDERYLSSFPTGSASIYQDKSFQLAQMSQMFNKSMASEVHPASSSVTSVNTQSATTMSKDTNYKTPTSIQSAQTENKSKGKRKRTSDTKHSQSYHTPTHSSDVLNSASSNVMVPGSAFNFGATPNIGIGSGLYPDNSGFSIEDFRNSTNQIMAANYMAAAAVAHQQRATAEANSEKMAKPAHQNSSHPSSSSFPFMGHGQRGAGYGFVGSDPSSPLYQQYLQRHQEELLRQTGAQIMGLYPPAYGAALTGRQPYDSINRSWL